MLESKVGTTVELRQGHYVSDRCKERAAGMYATASTYATRMLHQDFRMVQVSEATCQISTRRVIRAPSAHVARAVL
jgi:hypothetical protein